MPNNVKFNKEFLDAHNLSIRGPDEEGHMRLCWTPQPGFIDWGSTENYEKLAVLCTWKDDDSVALMERMRLHEYKGTLQ